MLSCSLPNSTTSSPRSRSGLPPRDKTGQLSSRFETCPTDRAGNLPPIAKQQNDGDQTLLQLELQRSKSCGEGRASTPSLDEFELCFDPGYVSSACKPSPPQRILGQVPTPPKKFGLANQVNENSGFTCGGALCVFLPTFSKGKAAKTPVNNQAERETIADHQENDNLISKRVSMQKFEWGSWSSTAMINKDDNDDQGDIIITESQENQDEEEEEDDEDSMNLYFDLPLELIRCSADDSPMKTAFVFTDHNQDRVKTYLKNNSSDPLIPSAIRDSHAGTSQKVRFPTESPNSFA